jgi:hypothetical protein
MEFRDAPIHNIIPTARGISKTTSLHSSPPNPAAAAKAATKKKYDLCTQYNHNKKDSSDYH